MLNCIPIKLVFLFWKAQKVWSPGSNLSHSDLHNFLKEHSDCCQPPPQGTTRPYRRFFSKASSSLSHSHLSTIAVNSPVVSCLKAGHRRQPRVQIQPRDSLGTSR